MHHAIRELVCDVTIIELPCQIVAKLNPVVRSHLGTTCSFLATAFRTWGHSTLTFDGSVCSLCFGQGEGEGEVARSPRFVLGRFSEVCFGGSRAGGPGCGGEGSEEVEATQH